MYQNLALENGLAPTWCGILEKMSGLFPVPPLVLVVVAAAVYVWCAAALVIHIARDRHRTKRKKRVIPQGNDSS